MKHFLTLILLISGLIMHSQDVRITDLFVGSANRAAVLTYGSLIDVYIGYEISNGSNLLIYATPYTNGLPTDGYQPTGAGTVSGTGGVFRSFSIPASSSNTAIDEVRIEVISIGGAVVYHDFFVPVQFLLEDVHINLEDLESPRSACFFTGEEHEVTLYFDGPAGPQWTVFVRPYSQGEPVGDITIPFGVDGEVYFQRSLSPEIAGQDHVHVDELRIFYGNDIDIENYRSFSVEVNWLWSPVVISNVVMPMALWPVDGVSLQVEFDYEVAPGMNALIYPRPITEGLISPGSLAIASPVHSGSGSRTSSFRVVNDHQRVDAIRFSLSNADGSGSLGSIEFPTDHFFGDFSVTNLDLQPPGPARIAPGSTSVHYDLDFSKRGNYAVEVSVGPEGASYVGSAPVEIPQFSFSYPVSGAFTVSGEGEDVNAIRVQVENEEGEEQADLGFAVAYQFASTYTSACGTDAPSLDAPVELSKSFRPVPFPGGVVDRVQLKWNKAAGGVRYQAGDQVGCDIQFWPIRDLSTDTPIIWADSMLISDVVKEDKELFKWPVKFKVEGESAVNRVEASTRYNWRVRCACDHGQGAESDWSETKIFNTPAFDPLTGIFTAPPGFYLNHQGELKMIGAEPLQLSIFPNPATERITIRSEDAIPMEQITIMDMRGTVLRQLDMSGQGVSLHAVDIEDLPQGIYLVQVKAGLLYEVGRIQKF